MQQKSIGKQIWELLSPILVYFATTFVVEFIVVMACYIKNMPELMETMDNMEALTEQVLEMSYRIMDYMVEITALSALVALPILIWMKTRDAKKDKEQGLAHNRKAPLSKYILIAGISIPLAVGLNNLLILSNLAMYSATYQETAEALYTPSLPMQILCVGIIIPITEEYIFRGLIFKRIRRNVTAVRAIVTSGIVFGLYHGNIVQVIYGFICGLLLAYLYDKYGSLKAPIFSHILMNLVSLILTNINGFTWMFARPICMVVITVTCATLASTMFLFVQRIEEKP